MEKKKQLIPQSLDIIEFNGGGGTSNPLNTRVWGSRNFEVKKFSFLSHRLSTKVFAFTMAEILISLTIIGIVAAIMIPQLHANFSSRTMEMRRKAFYSRLTQALAMLDKNINKYGQYSATYDAENSSLNVTTDTGAMAFLTDGLSKVMKLNNICDSDNLAKCGIPSTVKMALQNTTKPFPTTLAGLFPPFATSYDGYTPIDTKAAAFETIHGESVAVFYNPQCRQYVQTKPLPGERVQNRMCVNFIYDMNGKKGPNEINKDIGFITVLSPEDSTIVSPVPESHLGRTDCVNKPKVSRAPNVDEATSLVVNISLLTNSNGCFYWWRSRTNGKSIAVSRNDGGYTSSWDGDAMCVKW